MRITAVKKIRKKIRKNIRHIYRMSLGLALTVSLMVPLAAQAQETLEEIIVTAQKREENIRDVPIAITALSEEQLERLQINNIRDIQPFIPSISIARNTGTANGARIYLRGVGEDESRATVEPAIPVYIDGVYLGRAIGSLLDLVDVQQLEVLRGPQGTLYGRNSNGGAIRVQSHRPHTEALNATVGGTLGDYGLLSLKGVVNIPVSYDGALRIALLQRSRDGLFSTTTRQAVAADATATPPVAAVTGVAGGQEIGKQEVTAYRVTYGHKFDNLDLTVTLDGVTDDSDPTPPNKPAGGNAVYNLLSSDGANGSVYRSNVESSGLSAVVEWEQGNLTYRSLTSMRSLTDDLVSRIGFPYSQQTDQSQFSEEFQVLSNWVGKWNFVAGVFLFEESVKLPYTYLFNFNLAVETSATAFFGQGTYDISDTLHLTFGLRNNNEYKDFSGANSTSRFTRVQSRGWHNLTHKLALNIDLNEETSLYVANSSGFKSGAWSPDAFSAGAIFLPVNIEQVTNTEVGYRALLMDRKLRINATAFLSDYDNLQQSGTTTAGFARFNVPDTEISGLELELSALIRPDLELRVVAATLDAKFTRLDLDAAVGLSGRAPITVNDGTDGMSVVTAADVAADTAQIFSLANGLWLKNAPKLSWTVGGFWKTPVGNGLVLNLTADVAYESDSFSLSANPEVLKRKETALINVRVAVRKPGLWEASFWIKNLRDEIYYPAAAVADVYAADPMTTGVSFHWHFNP